MSERTFRRKSLHCCCVICDEPKECIEVLSLVESGGDGPAALCRTCVENMLRGFDNPPFRQQCFERSCPLDFADKKAARAHWEMEHRK